MQIRLYGDHDTGILVPSQQRVFAVPCLGVFDESPSPEKVLVSHDASQLARDCAIDVFHDGKVGGKENIKETLVDLS